MPSNNNAWKHGIEHRRPGTKAKAEALLRESQRIKTEMHGIGPKSLADKNRISVDTVSKLRDGKPVTRCRLSKHKQEEVGKLARKHADLLSKHKSYEKIAAELKVSRNVVRHWAIEFGLTIERNTSPRVVRPCRPEMTPALSFLTAMPPIRQPSESRYY